MARMTEMPFKQDGGAVHGDTVAAGSAQHWDKTEHEWHE